MELVFATSNPNKVKEANQLLQKLDSFRVLSLSDKGITDDIPETGNSLEANAIQKAKFIHDKYNLSCFSEDTGLEVDFLHGQPGIHSARYAEVHGSKRDNLDLLLEKMGNAENRKARFRTVICLLLNNEQFLFEGLVEGSISRKKKGEGGFGYDPVFIPDGFKQSFAQMDKQLKTSISHRGKAIGKLVEFLLSFKT